MCCTMSGEVKGMKNIRIGEKIAEYRRKNGLTLRDFAKQTNLSTALLSQLERNIGNPTLSILSTLAEAMGISVSELVEQKVENAEMILRKEQRKTIVMYQGQTMYDVLACDTCHANLELLLMTLEGKSWTSNGYTQHTQEEEVAYVLQGEVTIDLEGEVFVLGEEDTIRILPGRKHKLYNHTDTEVKVLFVKCRV